MESPKAKGFGRGKIESKQEQQVRTQIYHE
jgi:hypothetical protein